MFGELPFSKEIIEAKKKEGEEKYREYRNASR
jgi:hypothetical protein